MILHLQGNKGAASVGGQPGAKYSYVEIELFLKFVIFASG